MGTTVVSDSSYGWIQIVLEKRNFDAGDQINGFVNVKLLKPFPSNTLFLNMTGTEKTQGVESYTTTGK